MSVEAEYKLERTTYQGIALLTCFEVKRWVFVGRESPRLIHNVEGDLRCGPRMKSNAEDAGNGGCIDDKHVDLGVQVTSTESSLLDRAWSRQGLLPLVVGTRFIAGARIGILVTGEGTRVVGRALALRCRDKAVTVIGIVGGDKVQRESRRDREGRMGSILVFWSVVVVVVVVLRNIACVAVPSGSLLICWWRMVFIVGGGESPVFGTVPNSLGDGDVWCGRRDWDIGGLNGLENLALGSGARNLQPLWQVR